MCHDEPGDTRRSVIDVRSGLREGARYDPVDVGAESEAEMGRVDFLVFDGAAALVVDAGALVHHAVPMGVDRGDRNAERRLLAEGDGALDLVEVSVESRGEGAGRRVLGAADHGTAEGDDAPDALGPFPRRTADQVMFMRLSRWPM